MEWCLILTQYKKHKNVENKLTNLVLDVVCHTWNLVEKTQRLVHALLNDTQVGENLL